MSQRHRLSSRSRRKPIWTSPLSRVWWGQKLPLDEAFHWKHLFYCSHVTLSSTVFPWTTEVGGIQTRWNHWLGKNHGHQNSLSIAESTVTPYNKVLFLTRKDFTNIRFQKGKDSAHSGGGACLLVPALRKQRGADLCVRDQPGVQELLPGWKKTQPIQFSIFDPKVLIF